jgi:hypothetical protein
MSLRREATPVLVAVDRLIDDVLLRTLEPTVARVEQLLDLLAASIDEDGEPDGYDGIDREGALERLLPSEWLLVMEHPDEFVRRYEYGEVAYFKPRRRTERQPLSSLVLFDVGPDQLGRPRIVQLAALVVLARRASAVGSQLRWGTLQNPARYEMQPAAGPARLVGERSFEPVSELPPDAYVDDCLVVSPFLGPPYCARQLVLQDARDEVLATVIDRRHGLHRQTIVPVPLPDDAIRLLRDPTAAAAPAVQRTQSRPQSNLVFDQNGHKVFARVADDRLAMYPVPNSPKDRPGRIRYVQCPTNEGVIAAAGRISRSVLTVNVVEDGAAIVVRRFGGHVTAPTGTYRIEGGRVSRPRSRGPLGSLGWVNGKLHIHYAGEQLIQDDDCYRLATDKLTLRAGTPGRNVSAVLADTGRWVIRFGHEEWIHHGQLYGVYIHTSGGPSGWTQSARVLSLSADGRTVVATDSARRVEQLYTCPDAIADGAFHPVSGTYALRTETGRVIIRSVHHATTLYDLLPQ